MIFPIVIAAFVLAIFGGIRLYEEENQTITQIESEEAIDIISIFYRWKGLEELGNSED